MTPYFLTGTRPIEIQLQTLFHGNDLNRRVYLPGDVAKAVNQKWKANVYPLPFVPEHESQRYIQYSKMSGSTAKPIVIIDGVIWWGRGRLMAALLRGDKTIKFWDLRSK